MPHAPRAVLVLAAGEGTRFRSHTPKVLHGFAGRSLLGHVLAAAQPLGAEHTVVVVGHGRDAVTAHLAEIAPAAVAAVQDEQLGTAHAVRVALEHLPSDADGTVLVLNSDTPLLTPGSLAATVAVHEASGAAATVVSSVVADPTGYGRIVRGDGDEVVRIVEQADATPAELALTEIASGVYAFDLPRLREAIDRVGRDNAQAEEYLPDVVAVLRGDGHRVVASVAPAPETAGVNDRVQLAAAHRAYNVRLLEEHMRNGVTVVDPATTWVDAGVSLERDVLLLPSVDLHGTTSVAEGAQIGPQTSLTDTAVGAGARIERTVAISARVGARATVGPFAYLRPGTELAEGVHVGTYVEVKNSDIGAGSKVPHLTYVGDATIGAESNVGAATVFVNYDGVAKHRSTVGDHVRIGSDTMIVAPVTVGDGAYTAAGSVITQDVPPGAMAVARAKQRNVKGWVARRRAGTAADLAAKQAGTDAPEEAES